MIPPPGESVVPLPWRAVPHEPVSPGHCVGVRAADGLGFWVARNLTLAQARAVCKLANARKLRALDRIAGLTAEQARKIRDAANSLTNTARRLPV